MPDSILSAVLAGVVLLAVYGCYVVQCKLQNAKVKNTDKKFEQRKVELLQAARRFYPDCNDVVALDLFHNRMHKLMLEIKPTGIYPSWLDEFLRDKHILLILRDEAIKNSVLFESQFAPSIHQLTTH